VERRVELLGGQHGADAGSHREYQAQDDESRAVRGDRRGRRKRVLENPELFAVPIGFQVLAELRFVEFLEQRVIQAFRGLLIPSEASEFLFALRHRFEALLHVGDRLSQSGFVLLEPLDLGFHAFQRPESRGGRLAAAL
jgi:hypothetical protein